MIELLAWVAFVATGGAGYLAGVVVGRRRAARKLLALPRRRR